MSSRRWTVRLLFCMPSSPSPMTVGLTASAFNTWAVKAFLTPDTTLSHQDFSLSRSSLRVSCGTARMVTRTPPRLM